MNKYQQLKDLIESLDEDVIKFYENENNAAGTRVRTGLQEIKKLCQEMRLEVSYIKNNK